MKTALAGAGTRITRPHSIGDRLVLIIEAKIKKAGHEETDDGLVYGETAKVVDIFELDGDHGSRLLSTVRSLYRTGEATRNGARPVPGLGDAGYTDGSGVVLTPAELAELRGDPIRAMLSPDLTPVVVVYGSGQRELWPDDFPPDTPRPRVGDMYAHPAGGHLLVIRLLHHETGEELGSTPAPTEPEAEEDEYSGDLGDPAADDWETPDPRSAEQIAADLTTARIEEMVPTSVDFALVDCDLEVLRKVAAGVHTYPEAYRLVLAERQGRGRGLKPRKGALALLEARAATLDLPPF